MSNKNIDKLFQEKFKDFDQLPGPEVWERLEASLDKKKKDRKIIPIWFKIGGIAAVLALLFFALNPFKDTIETNNTITDVETVIKKTDTESKTKNTVIKEINLSNKGKTEVVDSKNDFNQNNNREQTPKKKSNSVLATKREKSLEGVASNQIKNKNLVKQKSVNTKDTVTKAEAIASVTKNNIDKADAGLKATEKEILKIGKDILFVKEAVVAATKEDAIVKKDTTNKKSIYDAIKETEEDAIAENSKASKWSLGASIAPVYFNSLNDGSPIHSNFVSNSKSGNVNMSFGVSVAYSVSKKLSIRSGLHKVNYGYNTNDVAFKSSFNAETNTLINSIDYESNAENVVVETNKKSAALDSESIGYAAKSTSREGVMVQQFGYLEVPLELSYALANGKFGVNLIGGVSSLFLLDDSITLESDNLKTKIGESNNINSLNFSTNVGVGFNYKFTPKIQLNIEPVFKYQLNTFSASAGDFQPFSMGVYSGLTFKF